jgi:predicted glycogen debranching enzyme
MRLPVLSLNAGDLSCLDEAFQKEWLVTNGLGGYASSTVLGVNTRKYHGLLVAALRPPSDRTVCLAKLDEDLIVEDSVFRLGANEFQNRFFPNGYVFLKDFQIAPFPKYVYVAGNVTIEKTLFMPRGKNAVAATYKFTNGNAFDIKARIFPLLTCRRFHSVVDNKTNPLNLQQVHLGKNLEVTCESPKATTILSATEGEFIEKPNSVNQLLYREETNRGESNLDDLYQPGYFEVSVAPQALTEFAIVAAADENRQECRVIRESIGASTADCKEQLDSELKRKADYLKGFHDLQRRVPPSDWLNWGLLAADSFAVRGRGNTQSVIAGYHWFEAWGRDTFISLPGLLLTTGRFDDAEQVLLSFARYVKRGLIPNFMPERSGQEPPYNTVDATLWYVNSVLQYLKYTGDFRFVEENLWGTLKAIVENHEKGTLFEIRLDSDGLLAHGPRLTWMDAAIEGEAVTPRAGKAVEIQALWYNALRTVQLLAARFGHRSLSGRCSDTATRARESFDRKFWNREEKCLFDAVDAPGLDESMRPNQIIAAALDFSILYQDKAEAVVDMVQSDLLTPFGLRTLSRNDPKYHGVYAGNGSSRNQAYHNGTVWPWLLGPFTTAFLKAKGSEADNRDFALRNFILPLFTTQLSMGALGTVSEIFDGDSPHKPGGCISQAWSVGEPLRAYVEDVSQVRPLHERDVLQSAAQSWKEP